jgi:hypothetical protein
MTWKWTGPPDPGRRSTVRVTREDFSTLVLHDVQVAQDTLIGSTRRESSARVTVKIPMDEVRLIEQRRLDATKTGLTILAIPGIMFLMILYSWTGTGNF